MIIRGKQRIGTVEKSLQLTAHPVIVNGGCKSDDIRRIHFIHDGRRIVSDNAFLSFLAGQAASAEMQVLSFQCDGFHLIAGLCRTFGKGFGQCVRITVVTQA